MADSIISKEIVRGDYWYPGEKWNGGSAAGFGFLFNSSKDLYIIVPNPKKITLLEYKTITVTKIVMDVHQSNGCILSPYRADYSSYTDSENTIFNTNGTVLRFKFTKSSGFTAYSGTLLNAAPVTAIITEIDLTFN